MERTPEQREIGALTVGVEIAGLSREETCDGPGFSPQIRIGGLNAPYLCLIMEDASTREAHWLLWNVPRTEEVPRNLPKEAEIDSPIRGRQGRNLRGGYGYAAPCATPGQEAHYLLRVYGLDRLLELDPATTTRDELMTSLEGHVLEYGELPLTYSKEQRWSPSAEY